MHSVRATKSINKMDPVLDLSHGLIQYGGKPCVMYLFGPDNQEWFDCRCIAEILGLAHLPTAMERVDPASKTHIEELVGRFGQPKVLSRLHVLTQHDMRSWVVDEAGLYELALGSRKPNSVGFRREVLPATRSNKQLDAVQHVMNMTPSQLQSKAGLIYLVTSPYMDIVKLGRWRGSVEDLHKRYKTYYGKQLELHTTCVDDCCQAEMDMLDAFVSDRASGELFNKEAMPTILRWLSSYQARAVSLKRKAEATAEAAEDTFTKRMAVGRLAVLEMEATTSAVKPLLEEGDDAHRVWGLQALKRAVITKDRRIDDFDRKQTEGPKEIYLSEVALAMGYDRKVVQPALARIGMQVRRLWNGANPDKAAEGPPKRTVVYNNKTRKENVYYEADRAVVEEGVHSVLGEAI